MLKYKQLLKDVEELQRMARTRIHQRVGLLCEIYDDQDYRADHAQYDDARLGEQLDKYVEDTALSFLQLRALLQEFPAEAEWSSMGLIQMWEEYRSRDRGRASAAETTHNETVRRTAKIAELDKAKEETKHFRAMTRNLETRLDESANEADRLRQENQSLREDLAKANGRIQELERIVSQFSPAAFAGAGS